MKRFFSLLRPLLPHAVLILSTMLLTFFVLDRINPSMAFLDNAITRWILCADTVLAIILAVCSIVKSETNPKIPRQDEKGESK